MIQSQRNYFRYLPATHELKRWGLGVTAAGWTSVPPLGVYPPEKHPDDHQMIWEHGRVLDALQVVLISSGSGWLETRATGKRSISAGMVFLILPDLWHRYRPEPKTGWTESWIEVQGPTVDELLSNGVFTPASVLRGGGIVEGIEEALDAIHAVTRNAHSGFQPVLSAAAMRVLALCSQISKAGAEAARPVRIRKAVLDAERFFMEHHAEPVNVEQLASDLGVAYSHFRRAFRAQTGMSPWKYVIHLRLSRARRMLASGDATLDDIASHVGFSSGFHLSNSFKQAYGESPDTWRRSLIKSR